MLTTIVTQLEQRLTNPALSGWKIYPATWNQDVTTTPFVKFSVVFSGADQLGYTAGVRLRGEVVFQLYVTVDTGQRAVAALVDTLRGVFLGNSLGGQLDPAEGYLTTLGVDPADNTLLRYDYHLPFTYYGE